MADKTYILEINETQAYITRDALEAYSRIRCAQIKMGVEIILMDKLIGSNDWHELLNIAERAIRGVAFPELNHPSQSYGVGHDKDSDIAWDLLQVIRHRLSWDNHDGISPTYQVNYNEPMKFGPEPLAKIEKKNV